MIIIFIILKSRPPQDVFSIVMERMRMNSSPNIGTCQFTQNESPDESCIKALEINFAAYQDPTVLYIIRALLLHSVGDFRQAIESL